MIVLDTHIWLWWISQPEKLSEHVRDELAESQELGVSAISCWEVAKLVERGRLELAHPVERWILTGLAYPRIQFIGLSPEIAIASTQLPGTFHRDPADQILVATARVLDCRLATADSRILAYEHVATLT